MGFVSLLLIGVSLAMDALAVSVCKGLAMRRVRWGHALVIALFFGVFQGIMPLIGWALGSSFAALIEPVDHWVAFVLLAGIGGKMLWDAFHEDAAPDACAVEPEEPALDLREVTMLAVATSIDALAVGITFAFLQVNIVEAVLVIGIVTFMLSFLGVVLGNRIGSRFERASTIVGGIVLILIGLKILLEHLGVLVLQ